MFRAVSQTAARGSLREQRHLSNIRTRPKRARDVRPRLYLDTHLSIAYLAGYLLGKNDTVAPVQSDGRVVWRPTGAEVPGELWTVREEQVGDGPGLAIAKRPTPPGRGPTRGGHRVTARIRSQSSQGGQESIRDATRAKGPTSLSGGRIRRHRKLVIELTYAGESQYVAIELGCALQVGGGGSPRSHWRETSRWSPIQCPY